MSDSNFPTPEQLHQRLQEFLRAGFAQQPEPAEAGPAHGEQAKKVFEFRLTPKDIKAHLDRFVIRQDEAKRALAIAVCDHYHHAQRAVALPPEEAARLEYTKPNVLLLGPTGVGKTYLVRHVAELVGVPFVKADATKFSETGYVGGDVEELVRELVHKADGDIELARFGMIYIDEIDKISSAPETIGRDVSGRGVQTALLKLMEETEVPLRGPHDLAGQLQAALEFQRKGRISRESINTRHILFIVSGAFEKLAPRVARRLRRSALGFGAQAVEPVDDAAALRMAETRDFVDYGMEPEFIGRLPVRVVCDRLTAEDLHDILAHSEGSLLRQLQRSFQSYGIEIEFDDEALWALAEAAAKENTGARGLVTVCENLFRDFKFELPGSGVRSFRVTQRLVREPRAVLEELLAQGQAARQQAAKGEVQTFQERFFRRHGVRLVFGEGAAELAVARAAAAGMAVADFLEKAFHDYEFGLALLRRHRKLERFEVTPEVLDNPDAALSRAIVESYRGSPPEQA